MTSVSNSLPEVLFITWDEINRTEPGLHTPLSQAHNVHVNSSKRKLPFGHADRRERRLSLQNRRQNPQDGTPAAAAAFEATTLPANGPNGFSSPTNAKPTSLLQGMDPAGREGGTGGGSPPAPAFGRQVPAVPDLPPPWDTQHLPRVVFASPAGCLYWVPWGFMPDILRRGRNARVWNHRLYSLSRVSHSSPSCNEHEGPCGARAEHPSRHRCPPAVGCCRLPSKGSTRCDALPRLSSPSLPATTGIFGAKCGFPVFSNPQQISLPATPGAQKHLSIPRLLWHRAEPAWCPRQENPDASFSCRGFWVTDSRNQPYIESTVHDTCQIILFAILPTVLHLSSKGPQ